VPDWPVQLETGVAGRAHPGEDRSGDRAVLAAGDGGVLVAAIDGLGHGGAAADAAAAAAAVLEAAPGSDLSGLLARCHAALRRTRGAVVTAAWFDVAAGRLSWTGVGNVDGRLVRTGDAGRRATEGAFVRGGVLGYNLPLVRVTSAGLEDGDTVVLATDGVGSGYGEAVAAGGPAQAVADRILAEHARDDDDALVVIVRYRASTLEGP
jgi:negative regulator of sigma-B (phosphoserine phosphatase)